MKEIIAKFSATDEMIIKKIQSLPRDYWDFKGEDTKELTHGIHTYPAVMVYPISRKIIEMMSSCQQINSLLDPFMGSGTVLVEGILAGFGQIYGIDLNPLAQLISKVKTTKINPLILDESIKKLNANISDNYINYSEIIEKIEKFIEYEKGLDITAKDGWGSEAPKYIDIFLASLNIAFKFPRFKNIGYWFKPEVIIELQLIKNAIIKVEDEDIRNFYKIALSEVIRIVSNRRNGEFKMFRMPADKIKKHKPNVKLEFEKILKRNAEKMRSFFNSCKCKKLNPAINIYAEDTRVLSSIADDSIDILVTSPPYGDSRTTVAYGEFSRLSLQWLDIYDSVPEEVTKLDKQLMGGIKYRNGFEYTLSSDTLKHSLEVIKESHMERAGDVYSFYKDLDDCIRTISKKMKINTYQFWVVGNRTVKLETLQTDKIVAELGKQYGLQHIYTIPRNIPNKVMPSSNSPTNIAGDKVSTMTNEHIVILRKFM